MFVANQYLKMLTDNIPQDFFQSLSLERWSVALASLHRKEQICSSTT